MSEILMQYVNKEIKDPLILARLRDDADFMLEVFKFRKVASEFDRVSDRLKEDEDFIQRTKDIFSDNSLEFFSLSISLRNYRKEKEKREAQQVFNTQRKVEQSVVSKKMRMSVPAKVDKPVSINVHVSVPVKGSIPVTINFDRQVPLRVESAKKASNMADTNSDRWDSFSSLVDQLPISKEERDLVIAMYQDATEEKKLVAWAMAYDFVNYNGKKHPIRLLKSPSNNVYRFTERF